MLMLSIRIECIILHSRNMELYVTHLPKILLIWLIYTIFQIIAYFTICVWLVPIQLILGLVAGENILPTSMSKSRFYYLKSAYDWTVAVSILICTFHVIELINCWKFVQFYLNLHSIRSLTKTNNDCRFSWQQYTVIYSSTKQTQKVESITSNVTWGVRLYRFNSSRLLELETWCRVQIWNFS